MNLQGNCFRGTTRKISESCIQLTQFAYRDRRHNYKPGTYKKSAIDKLVKYIFFIIY